MSLDNRANNTPPDEVWYLAKRKLTITNGPGPGPSTTRVEVGERFALDGDERNDFNRLLNQGFIQVYTGTAEQDAFIAAKEQERAIEAAKPRLGRRTRAENPR